MTGRPGDSPLLDGVSRETKERLRAYEDLVRKWSPTINLVSRATLPEFRDRHILDSAQIHELAPPGTAHWADLGSGGGLPGIVLAILNAERSPATHHSLVESDQRKAAFLRTCLRALDLTGTVENARAEDLPSLQADVVTARALAPLPRLLPLVHRHLAPGGTALLPKGQSAQSEVDSARTSWHFDLETRPSRTDPSAAILILKGLTRA